MNVLMHDSGVIIPSPEYLTSNTFACNKFGTQPLHRNWGLSNAMSSGAWTLGSWVRIPEQQQIHAYSLPCLFVFSCLGESLATHQALIQECLKISINKLPNPGKLHAPRRTAEMYLLCVRCWVYRNICWPTHRVAFRYINDRLMCSYWHHQRYTEKCWAGFHF
jgi:hypothetical protein